MRRWTIQHADGEPIATLSLSDAATTEECEDACRAFRDEHVASECDVTWFEEKS